MRRIDKLKIAFRTGLIGKLFVGSASLLWLVSAVDAQKEAGKKAARVSEAEIQEHIDRAWVKKAFLHDMMEHWLTASVMPNGFIQENLDRQWKPWGTQREASLNGQGRVCTRWPSLTKSAEAINGI